MTKDYEKLLKQAYKELPEIKEGSDRFEIPKVSGHIQGNKTVITNFNTIVSTLRREAQQIIKFLQRALASPSTMDGPRLIFGRKIASSLINSKLKEYTENFVLCSECKKPDTQLRKREGVTVLKCTACGAQHAVKAKI